MAIYSLHISVISRADGHSSVAACAYRRGISLTDELTGKTHDYSKRDTPIYNELSIPIDAPQWVKNLKTLNEQSPEKAASLLWNFVEAKEPQWNSELSREYRIALPIELSALDDVDLVRSFVESTFSSRGIISDWSIHFDAGNPHVHIMNSTRLLEAEEFGNKIRELPKLKFLYEVRKAWENHANDMLRKRGFDVRIDHRSNKDRGIELIPTKHLGKRVIDQERRGIKTERMKEMREIQAKNLKILSQNSALLTESIAQESPTFTHEKVIQIVLRYTNPHDEHNNVLPQSLLSENTRNYARDIREALNASTVAEPEGQNVESSQSPHPSVINAVLNELYDSEQPIYSKQQKASSFFEQVLTEITKHDSVISHENLAGALFKLNPDVDKQDFIAMLENLKATLANHEHIIPLGHGDDGRMRFTTRALFENSKEVERLTEKLLNTHHQKITSREIKAKLNAIKKQTGKALTTDQREAVIHLTKSESLSCLVGRAGTGKSFTMNIIKELYEAKGFDVKGVALSGIAASGLNQVNIPSRTIDSFKMAYKECPQMLHEKSVLIMDEAGMTDLPSMLFVMEAVKKAKAKLILLGDHGQLQPVGPGAVFRCILERSGFAMLTTIHRQKERWQKAATLRLARGEVGLAVDAYTARECVHLAQTENETLNKLVLDWKTSLDTHKSLKEQLVIAYRNKDVDTLNIQLRQVLLDAKQLAFGFSVNTEKGNIYIAKGDRLLFTKNYKSFGISNGSFGTVSAVDFLESGHVRSFQVQLDELDKPITISPDRIKEFGYGYAATIHKTQGITKDRAFIYVAGIWNRALTYVALTRHRLEAKIYASQSQFQTLELLKKGLARFALKDCVLDFPLAFARHHGIEPKIDGLAHHLSQKLHDVTDRLSTRFQQWRDPRAYLKSQKHKEILSARETLRLDAILVASYADKHIEVGQQWDALKEKVRGLDKKVEPNTKAFDAIARTLPEYGHLQASIHMRDAMAAQIHPKRAYHKTAIQLNRIDLNNLERHAVAHKRRSTVANYCDATGFAREQQAFGIVTQLRGLYTHLKAADVNTAQLNQEASQYVKRQLLKELTQELRLEQRATFDKVAQYLSLSQLIAKDWKTYGLTAERSRDKDFEEGSPLSYTAHRRHVKSIEMMGRQRDQLAYELFYGKENNQAIQIALQFYQIGEAQHWNGQTATPEDNHRASRRLDQLSASSNRHERLLLVKTYQEDVILKDPSRLKTAQTILDNPKLYHGSIVALNSDKKAQQELWQTIRQDAKRHQWETNFKSMTHDERLIYLEVQRYVDAKRSHAMAWREVFAAKDSKDTEPLNEKQINQLMQKPLPYTTLRNQLADNLMKSPTLYENALEEAGLSIDELKKQTYTHQCETNVAAYREAKTRLNRGACAISLIQDPKAHWPSMCRANINWKQVYRDANLFEQKQKFSHFSLEEKRLYRTTLKYRHTNQLLGKLYSELKSIPWKERTSKQQGKLQYLSDKRNTLAKTLQEQANIFSPHDFEAFATAEHLKIDKLNQQASQAQLKPIIEPTLATNKLLIKNNVTLHKKVQLNIKRLREDLNAQAAQIALTFLGEPKKRQGNQYRYGTKNGSLFVTVSGSKQGLWNDFQEGRGGDMLKLIQTSTGLDFKGTLQEATNFLGGESRYQQNELTSIQQSKRTIDATHFMQQEAIKSAKKEAHIVDIAQGTTPIQGTLAEKYLREHRAITQPLNSDNLRFHPSLKNWITGEIMPALVVLARDSTQKIIGLQATFLDPVTANKAKLEGSTKLSRGSISLGSIVHHAKTDNPQPVVALAEGLETALSIAQARPDWEVRLTFGVSNFEKTAESVAPYSSSIILCADNDGLDSGTAKSVKKTVEHLTNKNILVSVIEPKKPDSIEKWDFNDALKAEGLDLFRKNLSTLTLNLPQEISTMSSIDNKKPHGSELDNSHQLGLASEKKSNAPMPTTSLEELSPEQEEKFKNILKDYKKLRAISDKTKSVEDEVKLQQFTHKLWTKGKNLMAYTKEKYPNMYQSIQGFAKDYERIINVPSEKEKEYKDSLKQYKHLRAIYDKDPNRLPINHDNLTKFADSLVKNKALIQYAYAKYPQIAKNLNILSSRARHQEQDQSIDR